MTEKQKQWIKRIIPAFALVLVLAFALGGCGKKSASAEPLPVKVLILPAFEVEKMAGDFPGEAQFYYEKFLMDSEEYVIEGAAGDGKLYYKDGVALCLLGMGKVSAALTTNAVLSDARFDFSEAYVMMTGCAGAAAGYSTMGDVAVVTSTVDYDLGHHADPREMETDSDTTWFHEEEYDSVAVVNLNAELCDKVYGMVKNVKLETTEQTQNYLQKQFQGKDWANRQPKVIKGTSVTGDDFWKGNYDHANALLMVKTYQCPDPFAMTDMEDIGVAEAVKRAGMIDRLIILRDAVNLDIFPPGMTPEKLWGLKSEDKLASEDSEESFDVFETAMENNFKAGKVVIEAILKGEL